jgi:hypothetical protein
VRVRIWLSTALQPRPGGPRVGDGYWLGHSAVVGDGCWPCSDRLRAVAHRVVADPRRIIISVGRPVSVPRAGFPVTIGSRPCNHGLGRNEATAVGATRLVDGDRV